jgi:uncharacterized protein (TIGR02594 family)
MEEYPWLEIARKELGTAEVPGPGDNPRIAEYLHSTNIGSPANENDETAWCSAFVNWCVTKAGYKGTNSAWARSWLNWGVEADELIPGTIVVLERGPDFGHVGFAIGYDDDEENVLLLGGNQGDKVSKAWFPTSRVLGYRAPKSLDK